MKSLRSWATPMVIGSFALMTVTGTLMFFHLDSGLNKVVHEWAGWAMMAGVAAHVALNLRPFLNYLRKPVPVAVMAAFAFALALSFTPISAPDGPRGLPPGMTASVAMTSIDELITLSGAPSDQAYAELAAAGFTAEPGQSLGDITGGEAAGQTEVLDVLFGS